MEDGAEECDFAQLGDAQAHDNRKFPV